MFHVGYITYLSWLRRDPDYSAYIKRLKAERRADMEARKAERMKNPRRARRTPAQHRVRKVSWPVPWRLRNPNSCRPSIISAGGIIFYSKTPENVVNEKGHYFDHKRKFRKTWSNTEYQPAKNQYQNSKKRLQFKRRQNCRPKCRQTKTPKSAYKYRLSNHQKTIPKLRKTPCFQNIAKSMANENSQKRHALRRNFTYQNSLSNTEYPTGVDSIRWMQIGC